MKNIFMGIISIPNILFGEKNMINVIPIKYSIFYYIIVHVFLLFYCVGVSKYLPASEYIMQNICRPDIPRHTTGELCGPVIQQHGVESWERASSSFKR